MTNQTNSELSFDDFLARQASFQAKIKAASDCVLSSLVAADLTASESLLVLHTVSDEIKNRQKNWPLK